MILPCTSSVTFCSPKLLQWDFLFWQIHLDFSFSVIRSSDDGDNCISLLLTFRGIMLDFFLFSPSVWFFFLNFCACGSAVAVPFSNAGYNKSSKWRWEQVASLRSFFSGFSKAESRQAVLTESASDQREWSEDGVLVQRRGGTLDESAVHHRANTDKCRSSVRRNISGRWWTASPGCRLITCLEWWPENLSCVKLCVCVCVWDWSTDW